MADFDINIVNYDGVGPLEPINLELKIKEDTLDISIRLLSNELDGLEYLIQEARKSCRKLRGEVIPGVNSNSDLI